MEKTVELGTLISPAKTVRCGNGNYPVLSMTMHNGLVFQDEKFKKAIASKDTSDYKVVYRNQLVISFPIDEGVLAAQRIVDAGIVSPAYGVWDIDQTQVLPEYLEYALRCDRAIQYYKAKLRGSTARRRSLPTPTLLAFTIPLPAIEEQESILDRLHAAKTIIEKRETQIITLSNLIKARFVELFGDPDLAHGKRDWRSIASIGTVIGGATPKTNIAEYWGGEYRWLTPAELETASGYVYDSKRKLTAAGVKSCSLTEMPEGTVILSSRAPIGKVAIAGNSFYCNQGFKNIICNNEVHPFFLYSLLAMNNEYLNSLGRGATFKEISKTIVENIQIPVPPYLEQEEFAQFCKQVDKSKFTVQKALDEAQVLFNSLMQQFFG